jgi:hypothetical protein
MDEGFGEAQAMREWTEEKKAAFLEALAWTCNVRKSCEAADMDPRRAYALRLRDPEFALRWQEALAIGYGQVEERLIRDALGDRGMPDVADDPALGSPAGPMSASERELALNLLKFHHGEVGRPHAGGTPPRRATPEETDAAILARLAALKRRLAG